MKGAGTKQNRIWSKDFIALIIGNLTSAVVFYFLMTSIAVYAQVRFGANHRTAGFAVSAFLFGALLSRLAIGRYMDRIGRRRLLLVGLSAHLALMLLYPLAGSIAMLIVIRVLHGAAFGINSTVYLAAALASLPEHRKGEGNGYFSLGIAVATAIGPFFALFLVQRFSYTALFAGCAFFAALSLVAGLSAHIVEAEGDGHGLAGELGHDGDGVGLGVDGVGRGLAGGLEDDEGGAAGRGKGE
ncbi:MAG: MFS transporter, partial [Clostridiales Family XIII bacterium]|nr:MFS transporter [Clostridiales Family XIII bacterium]